MFIEINEIGRYSNNNEKGDDGNWLYQSVPIGKILINTDEIRCISITRFNWLDSSKYIVKDGSQQYCIYFDKDRYVNTDIESYNKIKKYVINDNDSESL